MIDDFDEILQAESMPHVDMDPLPGPEDRLRAMWTQQGVPADEQERLLQEIDKAAQPGARVGPWIIPNKREEERMLTKTIKFDDDVLFVLKRMEWSEDGLLGRIREQLERELYERVNKALVAMGGKWKSGKVKAHLFTFDPRTQVEGLIETGALVVKRDGFFETPPAIVDRMITLAELTPGMSVLEPSAGMGAIALRLRQLRYQPLVIELDEKRAGWLRENGFTIIGFDFLAFDDGIPFMRILMNPPFEEGQDMDHVRHAYQMLNKKGGRLVAIMGEHAFFADDKKSVEFRKWLDQVHGKAEKLPEGSFKESGTGANTRIVVISRK